MTDFRGNYTGEAYTSERLTVSTTAVGFTASKLSSTQRGPAQAVTFYTNQPIRIWYDGTVPTATQGIKLEAGIYELIGQGNVANFKAIRDSTATGDATLETQFLGG